MPCKTKFHLPAEKYMGLVSADFSLLPGGKNMQDSYPQIHM